MKLHFGIFILSSLIVGETLCSQCPFAQLAAEPTEGDVVHKKEKRSVFPQNKAQEFSAMINSLLKSNPDNNDNCPVVPRSCSNDINNYFYRTYDGSCNSFYNPAFGMAKRTYTRLAKPNYGDGVGSVPVSRTGLKLPSPLTLSTVFFAEETVADEKRTMITTAWGQTVAHDMTKNILNTLPFNCCDRQASHVEKCYPIRADAPIPQTDSCTDFVRSRTNIEVNCDFTQKPFAEKLNSATAYLDMSIVYGDSQSQNNKVRAFRGGLLKVSQIQKETFPAITRENCESNVSCGEFVVTDIRQSLMPLTLAVQTTLIREHNRCAGILAQLNPHWTDEKLFQVARKINIAIYQQITYYGFLSETLGKQRALDNQVTYNVEAGVHINDYNPHIDAAVYAEFASAAYRHGHSQLSGWFLMLSSNRTHFDYKRFNDFMGVSPTFDFMMNPGAMTDLVRGLISQTQKKSDHNIDHETKHMPLLSSNKHGVDLKAMDIQRSRDFGTATYNTMRAICGLKRAIYWHDFADVIPPQFIRLLQQYYPTPDDVDLPVGGSLERHGVETIFGPTFTCIIAKQFLKTRNSDRFFFEHPSNQAGFTSGQLAEIRKSSLSALLCTHFPNLGFIQLNAFEQPTVNNPLTNCRNLPPLDLSQWQEVPTQAAQASHY